MGDEDKARLSSRTISLRARREMSGLPSKLKAGQRGLFFLED